MRARPARDIAPRVQGACSTTVAVSILLLLALAGWGCGVRDAGKARRPERDFENLLLIVVDTLRSDHLPSYGYPRNTAPFLARLAGEGIQLQGYAVSSWTRPSMATLFTGLYPQRHQAIGREDRLPAGVPFLAQVLESFGFSTSAIVTNGNASRELGFGRGYGAYQEMLPAEKLRAQPVVDAALGMAGGLESPFYLYVHLMDPHDPYAPRAPWGAARNAEPYLQPQDVFRDQLPLDDEVLSRLVNQYDGEILEMDREIERLITSLRERGALDRTLVVVTSDHGEEFGEHGSLAHGKTVHEEVVQVPFLLWSREGLEPYGSDAGFHQVDFLPTVLEALGVPVPPDIDGVSWWAQIRDRRYRPRKELLFHLELDGYRDLGLAIGAGKVILRRAAPEALFFDLEAGSGERLRTDFGWLTRQRLWRRVRKLNRDLEARSFERQTAEVSGQVREQLEALGYAGD